ncbi:hypothetical protein ABE485_12270 [Achromobacter spanius]|uniref:hypothetical protein n=1 Tax=Achromobacter spanius TaxID=217203 RepID=UPI00320AA0FD
MQTFKDADTGLVWWFNDDVAAEEVGGVWRFVFPGDEHPSNIPSSLVPCEAPEELPFASIVPVVSRFQGREAMHRTAHGDGTLFEAAEAVLADPATPAMYRRAWDDLQEFRRDSEMLAAISGMLGLTAAQVDALFILAASIRA